MADREVNFPEPVFERLRDALGPFFGTAVAELSKKRATEVLDALQAGTMSMKLTIEIGGGATKVCGSVTGRDGRAESPLFEVEGPAARFQWMPLPTLPPDPRVN